MTRRLSLLAVVIGLGLTATVFSQNGPRLRVAQAPADVEPAPPPENVVCRRSDDLDFTDPRKYSGVGRCIDCHKAGTILARRLFNDETWTAGGEYTIWHDKDLHRQAYEVLHNDRSKRMGKILNYDNLPDYEVHRDKRCLSCHAGYLPGSDDNAHEMLFESVPDELLAGVSCESCHGPGETTPGKPGWVTEHYEGENWRSLSGVAKWQKFGYVDVRSPVTRMRMCASCHIGNAALGRVVTHEMYAAGHPPLPGFELDTFERDEPKHWKELHEKSAKAVADFLKTTEDPRFKKPFDVKALNETKNLLAASVVGLSELMKLNAELAVDQVSAPVEKGSWPELAQFDCYACHHDLEDTGWRFGRQPVLSRPGRPTVREWPEALPLVAARLAAKWKVDGAALEGLEENVEIVRGLAGKFPFGGDPETFAAAACALAESADAVAEGLDKTVIPPSEAEAIVAEITRVATERETWDHDSARQLAWGLESVLIEVEPHYPKAKAVQALLHDLSEAGRIPSLKVFDESYTEKVDSPAPDSTEKIVDIDLGKRLEALYSYDANEFRNAFWELRAMVTGEARPPQTAEKE